jgi:hypothetical protein
VGTESSRGSSIRAKHHLTSPPLVKSPDSQRLVLHEALTPFTILKNMTHLGVGIRFRSYGTSVDLQASAEQAMCQNPLQEGEKNSLKFEFGFDVHGPVEFAEQRSVEDLLHGDLLAFAPCNGDARVQVVDLGGAQSHSLQVLLAARLDLQLAQHCLLPFDPLHDPARPGQAAPSFPRTT